MLKSLVEVTKVTPDWSLSLSMHNHSKLGDDDFRFLAATLTFQLNNGQTVKSRTPMLFFEDFTRRSVEKAALEVLGPEWLTGKKINLPEIRNEMEIIFEDAWSKAADCSRLARSRSLAEAQSALLEPENANLFSRFETTTLYKRRFLKPIALSLPNLDRTVFFLNQIWQYGEEISEETAINLLLVLCDLWGGVIDPDEAKQRTTDVLMAGSANSVARRRSPLPEAVRHEVWRRDNGRCVRCGSQDRLEFDHIIPFSRGGSDTARNIQLLCESCNRKKHASI